MTCDKVKYCANWYECVRWKRFVKLTKCLFPRFNCYSYNGKFVKDFTLLLIKRNKTHEFTIVDEYR